jgi:hypothetical protein
MRSRPSAALKETLMTQHRLVTLFQALTTLIVSAALGAGMMVGFDYAARTLPI